jgi:hypothetical protein
MKKCNNVIVSQISSEEKSIEVILAGGLGNQLFQVARALHLAESQKVCLNMSHLKANSVTKREPDILDFDFGNNVEVCEDILPNPVKNRLVNFGLRLSSLQISELRSLRLVNATNRILNLLHRSKMMKKAYFVNSGVGFNGLEPVTEDNICLIGYFQSYKWLRSQNTERIFKNLNLSTEFDLYEKFQSRAKTCKPLVVHVRLGDYMAEKRFGTPTLAYYKQSILELWSTNAHKEIWLFSDNPELAMSRIPRELAEKCIVVENLNLSASQTLELMRLGWGYVISNSTFSWWGAYLSHMSNARVIYPNPWFADLEDPKDLCPEEWSARSRLG